MNSMTEIQKRPNKRHALERVMKIAAKGTAGSVATISAILAVSSLLPGFQIPPELTTLAGGVGINILSNILERMARGEEVSDDELKQQVEIALTELDKNLKKDEFDHAFDHLLAKLNNLHQEHEFILSQINAITLVFANWAV